MVRPIELKLDLELCFAESEELQEGIIKKYLSKLSGEKKESLEKIIDQLKDPNLSTKLVTKLSMHSDPGVRSIAVSHPNIDKETLKKIASDDAKTEWKSVVKNAKANLKRLDPTLAIA